jgi:hypothetical protein
MLHLIAFVVVGFFLFVILRVLWNLGTRLKK